MNIVEKIKDKIAIYKAKFNNTLHQIDTLENELNKLRQDALITQGKFLALEELLKELESEENDRD